MRATIIESPIEVRNRLDQLGWKEDELAEIVHAMVAARNGCTLNDPVGAPGWMSWKDGIRRAREIGAHKGLRRMDIDQVPWTVDIERCLKFTVINGNDSVGITQRDPQNRSRKGIGTERQVLGNAEQFALTFPDLPNDDADDVLAERAFNAISWYLFVYAEGDIVRAELSCPVDISNGFFTEFSERVFLGNLAPGPTDGTSLTHDCIAEFDIPLARLPGT